MKKMESIQSIGEGWVTVVGRLQEITEKFRSSQGNYLRKVEAREKSTDGNCKF